MTVKMADNIVCSAKQGTQCVIVGAEDSNREKTSRLTKKRVIIGISSVVVLILVIAGILIGVKFFIDGTENVIKRAFEMKISDDKKLEQDMTAYLAENLTQSRTKIGDTEVWTVSDFNKGMQVTKVVQPGEDTICYLSPLNQSEAVRPDQFAHMETPTEVTESKTTKFFLVFRTSVGDRSFLSNLARKLCDDIPIHWMTESTCPDSVGRQKRSCQFSCQLQCCWAYQCGVHCSWSW